MITRIGIISGEIITLLEESKCSMTVQKLSYLLKEPQEWVLMSVGWLLREGYLSAEGHEKKVSVSLRHAQDLQEKYFGYCAR